MKANLTKRLTEDKNQNRQSLAAEYVEVVRAELEARHNERVKQVDEILEKRTNAMKAYLTKRLTEGKNQIRQRLAAEHGTEHQQETDLLL